MMSDPVREGWYGDPAGRHEYRWFSQGTPTDLVMDRSRTSRDPTSAADLFQSMDLKRQPDYGPLLRRPDEPDPDAVGPIIRSGIDPLGLRVVTTRMARYGVYSWRFPIAGFGFAILIEFWLGLNVLTVRSVYLFVLLALAPLLWVGAALRGRLLERAVWRNAAPHDPSVLPLLAGWRLVRPSEYLKAGVVVVEVAVLTWLIVRQLGG
jgi:hypothetical protein